MTISWLQITATTHRTALAEAVFEQFGADAITELDAGDELTVEMSPNAMPAFARARVLGLFTQGTLAEPIVAALRETLGDDVTVETQTLENQDWASAWLAEHPPMQFGDRLWVAPHTATVEAGPDAIVMRLDPGLAFGTGTHPTTRLCLAWLAETDLTGKRVLDYGCGSGILAIAAVLLGAAEVVAVDIDDQAVQATRENAAHNGVANRVHTPPIDAIEHGPFDIVLANILARPLIELAPTLAGHAQAEAPIVLAGLLSRQIDEVRVAYASDFALEPPTLEDDWARLTGKRRTTA
ncbi:50S ribosomal protein L11 methyltransferase [Salinisphaera sp. Q1T1-3]|uniref:50S ribosomal protein L11 methyltransferase n=1 Tax=Salinisphaera sp. Q1T1-3 TaxID=2321229 RepID=UPI000E73C8F2|nr:50S ribosomal protein L11 methyltransferase [Salinisphaera sp. Q1T1-3]RJS94652.1 50S ribosomal protein L11 methyltransferase [Salinisphaera sp. Q1T1-3]